jgi:hypothetical protein
MRYVAAFQAKFGDTDDSLLLALFLILGGISDVMLNAARHPLWCLLLLALAVWLGRVRRTKRKRPKETRGRVRMCTTEETKGDKGD